MRATLHSTGPLLHAGCRAAGAGSSHSEHGGPDDGGGYTDERHAVFVVDTWGRFLGIISSLLFTHSCCNESPSDFSLAVIEILFLLHHHLYLMNTILTLCLGIDIYKQFSVYFSETKKVLHT